MNVKEIDLLKNSLVYAEVVIDKYSKYREESTNPEIKKAFQQVITAKKDHVNLIRTILKRTE